MLQTRKRAESPQPTRIEDLHADGRYAKTLQLVGRDKRVLEFGCATGAMSRLLTAAGNEVTAIEIDPDDAAAARRHCANVIVADLDARSLEEILPGGTYDVALFGDVLEHLRDPWRLLDETRGYLSPDGYAVMSIPNIAHGSIRLALLRGDFEYQDIGVLDDNQLRFFTARSIRTLCLRAGYEIETTDRTTGPLFAENGVTPNLDRASFPTELIEQIESDPHHDTLQFLIKARPLDDERKARRIVDGIASAEARAERAERALVRLEKQTRGRADAAAAHVADTVALHAAREEARVLREQARRRHVPKQTLDRLQLRTHDLAAALFGSEDGRTREFERMESGDASTVASRLRERLDALRAGAFDVARNLAAAKAENVELQASFRRQVAGLQRELAGATCELLAAKRAVAAAEQAPPEPCAACVEASAAVSAWREAYAPLYAYVSQIAALEIAAVKRERATKDEAVARIYRGARGRLKALAERVRLRPVR